MKPSKKRSADKDEVSAKVPTRFGTFILRATSVGLSRLEFPSSYAKSVSGRGGSVKQRKYLERGSRALKHYLQGKYVDFSKLTFDKEGYSPFEKRVLTALERIPFGRLESYKNLARKSESPDAARAVGSVMRKNKLPIFLPCHRVVGSSGGLGGYSKGLKWKRRLHKLEAVERASLRRAK